MLAIVFENQSTEVLVRTLCIEMFKGIFVNILSFILSLFIFIDFIEAKSFQKILHPEIRIVRSARTKSLRVFLRAGQVFNRNFVFGV